MKKSLRLAVIFSITCTLPAAAMAQQPLGTPMTIRIPIDSHPTHPAPLGPLPMHPASERIARITKVAWIGGSLGAALAFRTARTPAAFWAVTGGGAALGGYLAARR
jgi:hypothetical protein